MASLAFKSFRFFLLLTVLLVIFYAPFICGTASWFIEDITHFFEPLCMFIGRSVAHGHFPLWNPLNYCGMPQAAISSPGIFYPLNWIFALASFNVGLSFLMILSQALAGLGTFLLIYSFGWGELAAITGGIAIALSGYMFSLSNNYTIIAAAAWFPFLLWSATQMHKKSASPPSLHTVFMACVIGLLITAGRPEIWVPAMLCFISYLAYLIIHTQDSEKQPLAIAYARAVIIGGLISLPSMLPAIEWAPLSRRSDGLDSQEVLMFSSSWYDLLSIFVSQGLGELQLRHSDLRALVQPKSLGPYFSSAFVSTLVGALVLLGLQRKGGSLFKIAIVGIVIFVLASLGSNLPGADFLVRFVPGTSILRFPSKLLFFVIFGLALFAARGVRDYLRHGAQALLPEAIFAVGLLVSLLLMYAPWSILPFIALESNDAGLPLKGQNMIAVSMAIWCALALGMLLVLRLMQRKGQSLIGAGLACAACSIALLAHAYRYSHYEAPPGFFDSGSIVLSTLSEKGLLRRDEPTPRIAPVFVQRFTVPLDIDTGGSLKSSIGSYQYSRQVLRPFTNMDFEIPEVFGFEGGMVGEYYYLFLNSYMKSGQYIFESSAERNAQIEAPTDIPLARFLQMTASRIALTQVWRYLSERRPHDPVPILDSRFFELVAQNEQMNFRVYRVIDALPRAYLSYSWKIFNTRDDVISEVYDSEKSGWDANKLTLLESNKSSLADAQVDVRPIEPLAIAERIPERLTIEAAPIKTCILVLADQYYPGWKAKVDGVETPVLRCNGFMRGVRLKPGKHTVEFLYEPDSVKYGLLLAAVGCVWAISLLLKKG
ncbi:MAG: YfhO family protein [Candidatus Obscuribacterales bacterium]|nr:YfhO family protein [Candidatus Obscuribacterales bacterium]